MFVLFGLPKGTWLRAEQAVDPLLFKLLTRSAPLLSPWKLLVYRDAWQETLTSFARTKRHISAMSEVGCKVCVVRIAKLLLGELPAGGLPARRAWRVFVFSSWRTPNSSGKKASAKHRATLKDPFLAVSTNGFIIIQCTVHNSTTMPDLFAHSKL